MEALQVITPFCSFKTPADYDTQEERKKFREYTRNTTSFIALFTSLRKSFFQSSATFEKEAKLLNEAQDSFFTNKATQNAVKLFDQIKPKTLVETYTLLANLRLSLKTTEAIFKSSINPIIKSKVPPQEISRSQVVHFNQSVKLVFSAMQGAFVSYRSVVFSVNTLAIILIPYISELKTLLSKEAFLKAKKILKEIDINPEVLDALSSLKDIVVKIDYKEASDQLQSAT